MLLLRWASLPPLPGRDGTISDIVRMLSMETSPHDGPRKLVHRVLTQLNEVRAAGGTYSGERAPGSGGHNKVIDADSMVEQYLADLLEDGMTTREVTASLNAFLLSKSQETVGRSAVMSALVRLAPAQRQDFTCKQGDDDPDSTWAKVRLLWVCQLLVRVGAWTPEQATRHHQLLADDAKCDVPPYFNCPVDLHMDGICFW